MRQNHEHPLYHLGAETLLVATYIWVDDELKTLGVSKRLCTGGIPLLKHLLQHLPRLREPHIPHKGFKVFSPDPHGPDRVEP
jgi:hypothetical protein